MSEQEIKKMLTSLDEINKKLNNLNQLERFSDAYIKVENTKLNTYNEHVKTSRNNFWMLFALLILSTVIGIWGLNFPWFAGIAFGILFTGIISAFYDKSQL